MFKRKYHLNETIFEKINNEEKSYWLGFFAADGSITENKIRLCLSEKDYNHLMKWKKFTEWEGKDYYHKDTKAWEVYFRSTKVKEDLKKFTITERKTYTLRFLPHLIPSELLSHFVRGYFDADGCITKQTRKVVRPSGKTYTYDGGEFSIEANENVAFNMQKYVFIDILGLPETSIKYNHSIHRIRYGGIDQLLKIYNYLYTNSHIYLERKKIIFEQILLHRERLNERTLL